LLLASPFARHYSAELLGVPTVLIDYPGGIPGRLTVGSAAEAGAEEVVAHLISHGRTRVGLVIGDHGFGNPDPRERGWRNALTQPDCRRPGRPRAVQPRGRVRGGQGSARPGARSRRAVRQQRPPGDRRAPRLERTRRQVPEDIAVASFDGTKESEFSWPPLTAAKQQLDLLAAGAIDLLEEPGTVAGKHLQIDTVLIRRASCGCDSDEIDHLPVDVLTAT
jgi:LacI family transcriptional regulator